MNYKIDACVLSWHLTLILHGQEWLTQCQDNVTEWDTGSRIGWSDFSIRLHYKVTMSAFVTLLCPC